MFYKTDGQLGINIVVNTTDTHTVDKQTNRLEKTARQRLMKHLEPFLRNSPGGAGPKD